MRLIRDISRNWSPSSASVGRMERVFNTAYRYNRNISRYLGNPDDFISNSQYEHQVGRRIYMGLQTALGSGR